VEREPQREAGVPAVGGAGAAIGGRIWAAAGGGSRRVQAGGVTGGGSGAGAAIEAGFGAVDRVACRNSSELNGLLTASVRSQRGATQGG